MNTPSPMHTNAPATHQTHGAQTLRRGLEVLRLLARVGASGLRVGEIGSSLNLNKTTALRLTHVLAEEGFVVRDRVSGTYRLGPEAYAVGLAAEPGHELQRLAAPLLKALARETEDTIFFMVLHGDDAICLSRDEGDFPIRNQLIKQGDRWPLGVGAGSCALLASLPDKEIHDVLRRSAAVRAQRYPRCSDGAIAQMIAQTRATGYCVQPGLVLEDSWAVGAVIHDKDQRPLASISLAALKSRLGADRCRAIGQRLVQACHAAAELALRRAT